MTILKSRYFTTPFTAFFTAFTAFSFLIVIYLTACSTENTIIELTGKTMGTQYHISLASPSSSDQLSDSSTSNLDPKTLQHKIDTLLISINQQMSTYQPDSEISRFNKYAKKDWFPISKDFLVVVKAAQEVSRSSQGAFDITIAPLINLWGFGARVINKIPNQEQIDKELKHSGFTFLETKDNPPALKKKIKSLRIDLSAIAKGFAVDKVSKLLTQHGYKNFLVEIGGEIHASGLNHNHKKWRVAIEEPTTAKTELVAKPKTILELSNHSLATSGDYRNYFVKDKKKYSHTIDPKTGKPITHQLASVTVLHNSTMMADAYATAIMVLGETKGKAFAEAEKLSIQMIIHDGENYKNWSNLNHSLQAHSQTVYTF